MRVRIRAPSGVATIAVPDSATVQDLKATISEKTSLAAFDVKWGFPPQPLDLTQYDPSLKLADTGLKLDGEQLIVVARDVQSQLSHPLQHTAPSGSAAHSLPGSSQKATALKEPAQPLSLARKPSPLNPDDPPEIPMPSHGATMVLRVMPDDNSCMFRALGSAVLGDDLDSMTELRSLVAQGIQSQTDFYNEAILQKQPDDYCRWIQTPSSWGGGIELSILSQQFDLEVCSINVQDLRIDRFNEGRLRRCILVYSGIHYDTIALSPSEPPHTHADLDAEFDQKIFDADDDEVLEKALQLCTVLQGKHYYTDTAGFAIKCNTCGWSGKGEKDAVQHANETGHYDFGESG